MHATSSLRVPFFLTGLVMVSQKARGLRGFSYSLLITTVIAVFTRVGNSAQPNQ